MLLYVVAVVDQRTSARKQTLVQVTRAIWHAARPIDLATRGTTLTLTSRAISGSLVTTTQVEARTAAPATEDRRAT